MGGMGLGGMMPSTPTDNFDPFFNDGPAVVNRSPSVVAEPPKNTGASLLVNADTLQFNVDYWNSRVKARRSVAQTGPGLPASPVVTPIVRRFTSLDMTLPELGEQGQEYLFSSPQGELELSARYVKADWIQRGTLFACALGVWVLFFALYRCVVFFSGKWTSSLPSH